MLGYDDKRNFFRMMVNSPCDVTIDDSQSSRTIQAICKDISATGMSLEIEEASLDIGTQLMVQIESTSSQIPSLSAEAKVVRCDSLTDTTCSIGIEIIKMR